MVTRTCPPPTPWEDLHEGDVVTFQVRGMPEEATARIAAKHTRHAVLDGTFRTVTPDDYVRRIPETEVETMRIYSQSAKQKRDFAARVNELIETGKSVPDAVEQAVSEQEHDWPEGATRPNPKAYRNWRARYALPTPNRNRKNTLKPKRNPEPKPAAAEPAGPVLMTETEVVLRNVGAPEKAIRYGAAMCAMHVARDVPLPRAAELAACYVADKQMGYAPTPAEIVERYLQLERETAEDLADAPAPTESNGDDPRDALVHRVLNALRNMDTMPASEAIIRWERAMAILEEAGD